MDAMPLLHIILKVTLETTKLINITRQSTAKALSLECPLVGACAI